MANILIVDDESSMRFLLRATFEAGGHHVDEAANGRAAAELLESQREYDLVSTDFMMPVMNGAELIDRIRKNPVRRALPVILVSSSPGSERRTEADVFLHKPFDPTVLLERATQLMDKP